MVENLMLKRRLAATNEWVEYDFDGHDPVNADGWNYVTNENEMTRICYFESQDEKSGSTKKGHFTVIFEPESANVKHAYASLDGNDIGQRYNLAPSI